jgi:hypothetical protein
MKNDFDKTKAAFAQADLGIIRSAEKAERIAPGYVDSMVQHIFSIMQRNNKDYKTIEKIREECPSLPIGVDGRVWGAITRKAIKRGIIVPTGIYAKASSSNNSPKMLYRFKMGDR